MALETTDSNICTGALKNDMEFDVSANEWVDVFESKELWKKTIVKGTGHCYPKKGSLVTVKINGNLANGNDIPSLDSTETFCLGESDVIPAIDLCVGIMTLGEEALVATAPRFSSDYMRRDLGLPCDSHLLLTLKLCDIQPPIDVCYLSSEKRLFFGEKKRIRGNDLFSCEHYSEAIYVYEKAIACLVASCVEFDDVVPLDKNILECTVKCFNNMTAAQLKMKAFNAAIRSCEEVLHRDPKNFKALYRYSKALGQNGDLEKAISVLKKAIEIHPNSRLLNEELASLMLTYKSTVETEKAMCKKMFANTALPNNILPTTGKGSSKAKTWLRIITFGCLVVTAVSYGIKYCRRRC